LQSIANLPRVWPGILLFLGTVLSSAPAEGVRPFITDDARISEKGQVAIETFAQLAVTEGEKPAYGLHSLQAFGITDRLELTTGSIGAEARDRRLITDNLVLQPKFLLYQSFGAIPSVSTAAGLVIPLSGNRQQWDTYAMAHVSWFLFRLEDSPDPYDYWLAIYLNGGTKGQYDAGLGGRHTSKPFWAAGFEVGTFVRQVRFLAETFNGDPFDFSEEFPAYQTGFRWYKTPSVQIDIAWKGIKAAHPAHLQDHWDHSLQIGLRIVLDVFR
jgi:hypothetical protein